MIAYVDASVWAFFDRGSLAGGKGIERGDIRGEVLGCCQG